MILESYQPRLATKEFNITHSKSIQWDKVKKATLPYIGQVATCLVSLTLAYFFATTFPITAFIIVGGTVFSLGSKYLERNKVKSKVAKSTLQIATAATFFFTQGKYLSTTIHEGGHVLAAELLYKNARAKMSFSPSGDGIAHYKTGTLSKIGEYFGKETSSGLVSLAGSLIQLLLCLGLLVVAVKNYDKHPDFAKHILVTILFSIIGIAMYALSTFSGSPADSHDFMNLFKKLNISPEYVIATALLSPILILKLAGFLSSNINSNLNLMEKSINDYFDQLNKAYDKLIARRKNESESTNAYREIMDDLSEYANRS